jgi:aminoglycoside 6'-N-acetyltransferase I
MSYVIRRAVPADKPEWIQMRHGLWPEAPLDYLGRDVDDLLLNDDAGIFVAVAEQGQLIGFVEVRLRDYAEGCESAPVGYIEAWYVAPQMRGQKFGRDLVQTAEQWAREKGCTEMGSDTWLDNHESIAAHAKLGYYEVDRLVHFVKRL